MKTFRIALTSLSLMIAAVAVQGTSAAEEQHAAGPATSAAIEAQAVGASSDETGADGAVNASYADDAEAMSAVSGRSEGPSGHGLKLCCGTAGDYGVICWRC